ACEFGTYLLTELQWEADLLLCVLLQVIQVAGCSALGPLKQQQHHHGRDKSILPLFDYTHSSDQKPWSRPACPVTHGNKQGANSKDKLG
ncbi:hypothetical protein AMECASPLE_025335, partial [Ameca splendens]